MSAIIKIDAEGSAPKFADKVAGAFDRLSLSEGKVKGAMLGIGNALDGATSAADLASRGAEVLTDKLVKGVGGAAAVGAGKLISDAMRRVGADLTAAAESAISASNAFNTLDFKSAIASSAQMSAAIDKIKASADAIRESPNPFVRIADYAYGATKAMDELAEATERERQALLGLAAQQDAMSAEAKVGKTPGQRAEMDRLAQNKKELDLAGTISDPAIRARAKADIARRQAAEEQIKDDDRHAKSVEAAGKEAAIQEEKIREAAAKGDAEAKKIADEFDAKKADEAQKAQEDADKPQASRVSPGGSMGGGAAAPAGMSLREVAEQGGLYGRNILSLTDRRIAQEVKKENQAEAQKTMDATKVKIRNERTAASRIGIENKDFISDTEALNRIGRDIEESERKARAEQRTGGGMAEGGDAGGGKGDKETGGAKRGEGAGEKGIGDIYNLLDDNLKEMRTYAYVK